MLESLRITNFAIIKEAAVDFAQGFTVLTGETGAGKSIIIDAISLLLGARSKEEDIKSAEDEAQIEGVFSLQNNKRIKDELKNSSFDLNDGLSIRRIINRSGKNKIFINGSLSTLGELNRLGGLIIDICAENENRMLMDEANHIDILDSYGSLKNKTEEFEHLFEKFGKLLSAREDLTRKKNETAEKSEFLRHISKEIKDLKLREGEEDELKGFRKKLQNLEKIRDLAHNSYEALYSGSGALIDNLDKISKNFDSLKILDPNFKTRELDIPELTGRFSDASFELKKYIDDLDYEPGRLDEIEERLDKIGRVIRKYGGIDQAILKAKEADEELNALNDFDSEIEKIDTEKNVLEKKLIEEAEAISKIRKIKAKQLDEEINGELRTLNMEGAKFVTRIFEFAPDNKRRDLLPLSDIRVSKYGKDSLEFFISTNVGEESKPLKHVASLGELSRVMLAIKGVFYSRDSAIDTFIFDEIDTGIGGKVAEMVGKKLKKLSLGKQVVCVTHLSQIASHADNHLFIKKEVLKGKTQFSVKRLTENERKDEIARMIGGMIVTDKTRALAEELLEKSS